MSLDQYRQNWREANAPVRNEERIGRQVFALVLIALFALGFYVIGRSDEAEDIQRNYVCEARK